MAHTPFTLAALATSAVPGLKAIGTRAHGADADTAFLSAVIATGDDEVIVRIPTTPAAEVIQSGELLGQAALIDGARDQLPFTVPKTLGMTRAGDTRAVVSTFLPGTPAGEAQISDDPELLQSIVEGIAALHELPIGIVQQGGLPMRSTADLRTMAARLVQRAADTGLLPETVHQRWSESLEAEVLWGFEPTVTHGSLGAEQLLVEDDRLLGVLGWSELALGDPAFDLAWLLAAGDEVFQAALVRYASLRDLTGVREFTARARFHHELEVAKWLLHGVETHDNEIVDDAVTMLDRLVDRINRLGAPLPQHPVLSETEVERLLEETPRIDIDQRSETAEFEALDEDRAFDVESDSRAAEPPLGDPFTGKPGDSAEPARE